MTVLLARLRQGWKVGLAVLLGALAMFVYALLKRARGGTPPGRRTDDALAKAIVDQAESIAAENARAAVAITAARTADKRLAGELREVLAVPQGYERRRRLVELRRRVERQP